MANVKGYLTIFGVTLMLFFISLFFRSPPQVASPHFLKAENAVHSFKSLHYWKRDSLDLNYWPKPVDIYDKYFTFKSWGAGFNNERISLELAFCFAFLTNRTLVCDFIIHAISRFIVKLGHATPICSLQLEILCL